MKTIIIGGGAAGFFLAINLKEMVPGMDVTIIERSQHLLNKVSLSGGGRCNCTNTFQSVEDLKNVYPRGHQLMKRLFRTFGPQAGEGNRAETGRKNKKQATSLRLCRFLSRFWRMN